MTDAPSRAQRIRDGLHERRARHRRRGRLYRTLFVVAGAIVTLAGLAMLVTPGPALVIIPIGLAMLAMEFAWAEVLLHRALEHAENAERKAVATTKGQRILIAVAVVLAIAAVGAAAVRWDIPALPV